MKNNSVNRLESGQKIAIIGAGISGLGAAWLLSQKHNVVLYESTNRLGGHAYTVSVHANNQDVAVDIGFIVFNEVNYPNLCQLFNQLDVAIHKSDMSFGVSVNNGEFEYACRNLKSFLAQPGNAFKPAFWRMYKDIRLFFRTALEDVSTKPNLTVQGLIDHRKFSSWFVNYYLLPMSGAIWSTPRLDMLNFPAKALVQFFANHGLLSFSGQHQWWTVTGGSQNYVSKIATSLNADIRLRAPVTGVIRKQNKVCIKTAGQEAEIYDSVVFACHSDITLSLLKDASNEEQQILGNITYKPNKIILHTDPKFMPKRQLCWSSWVYLANATGDEEEASVTYWMNSLQGISEATPLFATLNPPSKLDEQHILFEQSFAHPQYDTNAFKAQLELPSIQGKFNSWYCGAWTGMGFHEDGLSSAIRIAEQLGVKPQWQ